MVCHEPSRCCWVGSGQNLPGKMNSARFALDSGGHVNKKLQAEWNRNGAESFRFEVLDELPHQENAADADYPAELATLKLIWEEKLQSEGYTLF